MLKFINTCKLITNLPLFLGISCKVLYAFLNVRGCTKNELIFLSSWNDNKNRDYQCRINVYLMLGLSCLLYTLKRRSLHYRPSKGCRSVHIKG